MPLNEYFRQLGQTTPYQVSPLAQLLRGIFAVREHRKQQAEQTEEQAYRKTVREAEAREMELRPLRERANFYLTQYQQDPRGAFKAAYEDNPEFRQLTQRLYGFQAPTVTTGIPGGPEIAPAPGQDVAGTALSGIQQTFKLPGPPPPAFRTVGEMAAKFGLKLKPGVDAHIAIDTLPRNINANQLFIDPAEEREKERGEAAARIKQLLSIYKIEQVFAMPQLREPFLRDYEAATGAPFPTRTTPETVERRTPETITTTPAISGTGPGLVRAGLPQTVRTGGEVVQQVPTGREMTLPIFPEPQMQRVVLVDNTGRVVQDLQVPEGAQVKTVTAPTPREPARAILTDSRGNIVRTIEAPPGTQFRVLPAPPRAGGGVSAEGLTPSEQRLVGNYNRLVDQRTRLIQIQAQGMADPETMTRVKADVATLDAQIARLQPQVERILYKGRPAPAGRTDTATEVTEAARRGMSWEQVAADLKADGIDPGPFRGVYDANVTQAAQKPKPTISGLSSVVQGWKSQGMTWGQARILLMRELLRRGYDALEAKEIADGDGKRTFDRASGPR